MCRGYFICILLCMAIHIVPIFAGPNGCHSSPCMNGGICRPGEGQNFTCDCRYSCSCANDPKYAGDRCENDMTSCVRVGEYRYLHIIYGHNCSKFLFCGADAETLLVCSWGTTFDPQVKSCVHTDSNWCYTLPGPKSDRCTSATPVINKDGSRTATAINPQLNWPSDLFCVTILHNTIAQYGTIPPTSTDTITYHVEIKGTLHIGMVFSYQDMDNYDIFYIWQHVQKSQEIVFGKVENGTWTQMSKAAINYTVDQRDDEYFKLGVDVVPATGEITVFRWDKQQIMGNFVGSFPFTNEFGVAVANNHNDYISYRHAVIFERYCPNVTCSNGGTCKDTVDGYLCICLPGYTGYTCEVDIDECEYSTCKNGASCKDGINAYVCDCEDGFEGDDCDISVDWYLLFSCDIDETVAMLDLQKGTMENLLPKETLTSPRGLTYDTHTGSVYVIDGVDVWNISLDEPAGREKIHTLSANGQDIALDYSTGWLYVSKSDYALERVDSNGVSQYTYDNWYGLGFDHIGGYLYWVTNGFIKRESSLDISNMTSDIVVNMGQSSIKDVYIDSKRDLIFWCTSVGHVYQSTMSGSVVELIVHIAGETLDYITGIGRHLYIGGYSNNRGAGAIFDIYNGSYSILEVSRSISTFGIVAFSKPSKVCPFECQNGGTLDLETCICECPSQWMGVACDVQPETRSTEVVNVWPNFGPEAGGTAITCTGMHLPHQYPITVNIGYKKCNTTKQNSTTVIAVTPSLGESEPHLIGADLPIYLTVGHINLTTPYTFVYKGNPVIDDVYPKESIVKGGTKLTANGNNLDSVAVIVMDTTMVCRKRIARVYNETIVIYKTNCDTQNRTQMVCPTPTIELPEEFKNTSTKSSNGGDSDISISVGNNTLEFYVGFRLDGVKGYDNFSDLKIFAEPVFKVESDRKIIFVQNERIEFDGDNIDKGITVYDYSITIGKGDCGRLELLYNSLSCMPPQNEPERLKENYNLDNPRIVIHAGLNIKHAAGYLVYPDSELPWYILYIVVPVCGVILIVIIIVIIAVCCKRRNRATRSKEATQKDNGFDNDVHGQQD